MLETSLPYPESDSKLAPIATSSFWGWTIIIVALDAFCAVQKAPKSTAAGAHWGITALSKTYPGTDVIQHSEFKNTLQYNPTK